MVDGVDQNGSWILSDSTDNEPDPHGPIRTAKFFVRGLARRGKLDNTVDTVQVSVEEEDGDTRWEIDVYAKHIIRTERRKWNGTHCRHRTLRTQ